MSDYVTKTNVLSALARFKENTDALYETKADANVMKSEINQHESRLENLEQKAGDYSIVQYRGTNAVPTGKAKYGLVKSIIGKTRAWNQLVLDRNGDTGTLSDVSYSISNGKITLNGTATSNNYITFNPFNRITIPTGHKVLLVADTSVGKYEYAGKKADNSFDFDRNIISSEIRTIGDTIIQFNSSFRFYTGEVFNNLTVMVPQFYDLTLIFGAGNEPSTVADALAQLPALGEYNAHDAGSLVDTEVSGVESRSKNLFDISELKSVTGGTDVVYDGEDCVEFPCGSTFQDFVVTGFKPNTRYTISARMASKEGGLVYFVVEYTDGTTASVLQLTSTSLTNLTYTTTDGKSVKSFGGEWITANYHIDLVRMQIEEGTTATDWSPFGVIDNLSLPETVTLRSARSVAEVLDVQTGEHTHPVKQILLKDLNYQESVSGTNGYEVFSDLTDAKASTMNLVSDRLVPTSAWEDVARYSVRVSYTTRICITVPKSVASTVAGVVQWLTENNVSLCYELATPDPSTFIDPVPDNFIEVQGGGTIDTIQTQSPVIDNCLDVGYLAV